MKASFTDRVRHHRHSVQSMKENMHVDEALDVYVSHSVQTRTEGLVWLIERVKTDPGVLAKHVNAKEDMLTKGAFSIAYGLSLCKLAHIGLWKITGEDTSAHKTCSIAIGDAGSDTDAKSHSRAKAAAEPTKQRADHMT